MDKIIIKEARFLCNLGYTKEERKTKQEILVDIELFTDVKKSAKSKNIEDTINYSEVHSQIKTLIEDNKYILIETLAEEIAKNILEQFNIKNIMVRVKKPLALRDRNVKYTAVEITRSKVDLT